MIESCSPRPSRGNTATHASCTLLDIRETCSAADTRIDMLHLRELTLQQRKQKRCFRTTYVHREESSLLLMRPPQLKPTDRLTQRTTLRNPPRQKSTTHPTVSRLCPLCTVIEAAHVQEQGGRFSQIPSTRPWTYFGKSKPYITVVCATNSACPTRHLRRVLYTNIASYLNLSLCYYRTYVKS